MPLKVDLRSEFELEQEYKDTVMVFKQDEKVSERTADMMALHWCAYQVRKIPHGFVIESGFQKASSYKLELLQCLGHPETA